MDRAKAIGLIVLTAAMIFFAGQNLDSVEVVFLAWTFSVPLTFMMLVPLLVGLIVGTAGTYVVIAQKQRTAKAGAAPEADADAEVEDEAEPEALPAGEAAVEPADVEEHAEKRRKPELPI
jgi:uncharacterized integral membrane protein